MNKAQLRKMIKQIIKEQQLPGLDGPAIVGAVDIPVRLENTLVELKERYMDASKAVDSFILAPNNTNGKKLEYAMSSVEEMNIGQLKDEIKNLFEKPKRTYELNSSREIVEYIFSLGAEDEFESADDLYSFLRTEGLIDPTDEDAYFWSSEAFEELTEA